MCNYILVESRPNPSITNCTYKCIISPLIAKQNTILRTTVNSSFIYSKQITILRTTVYLFNTDDIHVHVHALVSVQ